MAKTLISSTTSWLPATQFIKRNDARTIADVVGDDGIRPYQNSDGTINTTSLAADTNLLAALASASGQFEGAVYTGARYSKDDLTQILTTTCNAQAFMFDIISRIARFKVIDRRVDMDPEAKIPEWYKETKELLQALRDGQNIFGFQEHADAGLPKARYMSEDDWQSVQTTVTQAKDFFGRRNKDFRRPGT